MIQFKKVCRFSVKKSSSAPQAHSKSNALKTCKKAIPILRNMKFPLIISVMGTHACYHHIVVIWRRMIIDYESKYTFSLTNDSLRQICGVNTTFVGISCGHGIFPANYGPEECPNNLPQPAWRLAELFFWSDLS